MSSPAYASPEDEFWYNVSQQDKLPIAGEINLEMDLHSLYALFGSISSAQSAEAAKQLVLEGLISDLKVFGNARQFLGISDKRAYLELSYVASRTEHPSQPCSLCGCHPWTLARHQMNFFIRLLSGKKGEDVQRATANMIADYLMKQGLYEAAKGFSTTTEQLLELIYTRLIKPKEYQQKAAKRRGHGCEGALARVLEDCGVSLLPTDKASDPMGTNDPHLNLDTMMVTERVAGETHAFDMLVLNNGRVCIAIQSLIHTSDPGQFGVDKSNESVDISKQFDYWNTRNGPDASVELWGLVDGVGYSENKKDTINKLLQNFNFFMQIKTLYKAALRLHVLGLINVKAICFSQYYNDEDIAAIERIYLPKDVSLLSKLEDAHEAWTSIDAGEATIFI